MTRSCLQKHSYVWLFPYNSYNHLFHRHRILIIIASSRITFCKINQIYQQNTFLLEIATTTIATLRVSQQLTSRCSQSKWFEFVYRQSTQNKQTKRSYNRTAAESFSNALRQSMPYKNANASTYFNKDESIQSNWIKREIWISYLSTEIAERWIACDDIIDADNSHANLISFLLNEKFDQPIIPKPLISNDYLECGDELAKWRTLFTHSTIPFVFNKSKTNKRTSQFRKFKCEQKRLF